mgnify:CR=1 FL=1
MSRACNSPQGSVLLASRFGMDITIARPNGYDMDPILYGQIKENCKVNEASFDIIDDPVSAYEGAHVVYSRHWISPDAYQGGQFQKQQEIEKALSHKDWITTEQKMKKTENAIFTHPMPVDRGNEVEDGVASGRNSVIYTVASNRLHVQKSVIANTMGGV